MQFYRTLGVLLAFSLCAHAQSPSSVNVAGAWRGTFADSIFSGVADVTLNAKEDGTVSGPYKASTGGSGRITGKLNGDKLTFTLIQDVPECPGSYAGTLTFQGATATGDFVGSDCQGEHRNGVISIFRADSDVPAPTVSTQKPLSEEAAQERAKVEAECPTCKKIFGLYFDPNTRTLKETWVNKNQKKFLKENYEKVKNGRLEKRLQFVRHKENATYLILWTQAVGYRPYVRYVPHTDTDTGRFSGTYRGMSGSDLTWGNFQGTVEVERTYYTQQTGVRPYLNVYLTVLDAKTGRSVFNTYHQGNWLWSKPDKDCLADAINFLRSLPR